MVSFEQAKKEINEILDNVDSIKDIPTPGIPAPSGEKKWYNDNDGCSMRMSYSPPLKQVYAFNCGSYSVRQCIWSLLGLDLSDKAMADYAVGQGWMNSQGMGHSQLANLLNYSSSGKLGIEWKNFSDVGFAGLDNFCNDPNKAVIIHSSIACSDGLYGHYWVLKKVCIGKEQVVELRSVCTPMENNVISFDTFKSKIGFISQPSIGVVYRK